VSAFWLIAGLGNPGKKYEYDRHNLGFLIIDRFAEKHHMLVETKAHKSLLGKEKFQEKQVILIKPQTYMNLSGEAVRSASDYYQIPHEQVLVVHDDLDLEFGKMKFVFDRGHGGHNGVRSAIDHLGTKKFYRLRAGIGGATKRAVTDFVLSPFSKQELKQLPDFLDEMVNAIEDFLTHELSFVQTKYH